MADDAGAPRPIRLAEVARDGWELRSAEESHRRYGDSFWVPPRADREALRRGQAAKLIFDIADEMGDISGERMFVIVTEKVGEVYLGILDNQPATLDPDGDAYLRFGAEIPFTAEHVIDIAEVPQDYVDWQLGQPPERTWPR